MIKVLLINRQVIVSLFFISFLFIGCEKKTEKSEQPKEEVIINESTSDNSSNVKEPDKTETVSIPDIKGTWTGTFDKRSTTLKITEQTDSSFSGTITINYRQVINQEIKGIFSPASKKITMTDQLHSRYQGSYSGKLSDDLSNYSGTFTMKVDGSKFSFNLNKK